MLLFARDVLYDDCTICGKRSSLISKHHSSICSTLDKMLMLLPRKDYSAPGSAIIHTACLA